VLTGALGMRRVAINRHRSIQIPLGQQRVADRQIRTRVSALEALVRAHPGSTPQLLRKAQVVDALLQLALGPAQVATPSDARGENPQRIPVGGLLLDYPGHLGLHSAKQPCLRRQATPALRRPVNRQQVLGNPQPGVRVEAFDLG
jgi:hypothetical protein